MLYIKKINLIFALLLGVFTLFAQPVVPGLRGKRLSVEGNFAVLPFLVAGPTAENAGWNAYNPNFATDKPYTFPISWRASLIAHYITGRKHAAFAGLHYYNTGLTMTVYTLPNQVRNIVNTSNLDRHALFMDMQTTAIELGSESNTGQAMLAPIGSYFRVSLLYYMMNAKIVDKYTFYAVSNKYGNRALGLDVAQTWDAGIGLEFGSRSVVAQNVMFNWGIRSNLPVMWIFGTSRNPPSDNVEVSNERTETAIINAVTSGETAANNQLLFQTAARKRNSLHELIMFNFGVSYYIK